jgi:hypothetical protein
LLPFDYYPAPEITHFPTEKYVHLTFTTKKNTTLASQPSTADYPFALEGKAIRGLFYFWAE